jgi:DNA repair protein RecN (Recombination protein N)
MLAELIIRNIAIIEELHLHFESGLNVLTGETGAGKSIIIDAVSLLMGGRASTDLIRTGADEAVVEAVLDLTEVPRIQKEIGEAGFDESSELLVKRIVSRSGKNRIYINGSMARVQELQRLTRDLISIYGQHEHQNLQRTESHLDLLDRFAGLVGEQEAYQSLYQKMLETVADLARLEEAEKTRRDRLDLLSFQKRELAEADIRPGEDQELEAERLILRNAEKLAEAAQGGYETLYGSDHAIVGELDQFAAKLEGLLHADPSLQAHVETLRSALFSLEDVANQLRDYAAGISMEEERLNLVEQRLRLLVDLKRKYAPTLEGILALQEEVDGELEQLENLEVRTESLRKKRDESQRKLLDAGRLLSEKRSRGAKNLCRSVEKELADLAMPKSSFEVRFSVLPEPGMRGLEKAEFYLSANPGEEPKPLVSIASGGELSRIMLALKRAAPEKDTTLSMIFDEVDAGIGGAAGTAVGEKLSQVSGGSQVLCITHLPQVAAFADAHFLIAKKEDQGRTFVETVFLEGEDRVREMARMLGGSRVTESTLESARELVKQSKRPQPTLFG